MDADTARDEGRRLKEEILRKVTETLPRDTAILVLREAGFKLDEIGEVYGLTGRRVGQIVQAA